jgi:glucose-1-phosphate cytidylyltransferase
MKVAILAGGLGTRLSEETVVKPKPMVEVGEQPILWHILKHYAYYGSKEFFIALGYKGEYIKRYFLDYYHLGNNLTIDLSNGAIHSHHSHHSGREDWIINLIDTGADTNTGGRVKRLQPWLGTETFMLTYGDGISNLDLRDLLRFHRQQGRLATITAVRPPARFGGLVFNGDLVVQFTEKPQIGEGWINGGFMVLEPAVFQYLDNDDTNLEAHVLERLSNEGQLAAYRHDGFWQCMDTLRDKRTLDSLWGSGKPPWKVWDD